MARNNRAASMEKERWGGEGYLDNRAGDRSTMAAVFSIRHYLIDRVAGLIVRGGYFRAAFVWGSAILPHPSSTLNSLNPPPSPPSPPQRPCYLVCACVYLCMYVWVRGQRAGLLCALLFAFHQQRAKCSRARAASKMEGEGNKREAEGDRCRSARASDPVQLTCGVRDHIRVRRHWPTLTDTESALWRLPVEYCEHRYRLNRVIVVSVSL